MTDQAIAKAIIRKPKVVFSPRGMLTPLGRILWHWGELGGSPGKSVSDLEPVPGGHRIRYEYGSIYVGAGVAWVYGAIAEKYDSLGGPESWLGLPVADEAPFSEGGRVSVFQNGAIYWWPDVGAIEMNDVSVRYTGLVCFGETDWDQGSDSDEPYVILGVVAPQSSATERSAIYNDVDSGDSRPDLIEIFRGKPYGVNVSTLVMEYDYGNPDEYKDAMAASVAAAAAGVTTAIALIPYVGPALAAVAGPALGAAVPTIAKELNQLLDTGDDKIGQSTQTLSPKQMVVLAAQAPTSVFKGIAFKVETPLLTGHGASYKAYFDLVRA